MTRYSHPKDPTKVPSPTPRGGPLLTLVGALALTGLSLVPPVLAAEDGTGSTGGSVQENAREAGRAIGATAEAAGETVADTARDAGEAVTDTAKQAGRTLADGAQSAGEAVADTAKGAKAALDEALSPPAPPKPEQLAALKLPSPLHEVTDGVNAYSYSEDWTGPKRVPSDLVGLPLRTGEETLAEIDGLLANDGGEVVAVIADTEGFLNLNLLTPNVVVPVSAITYEPSQNAFQTDLTMEQIKALPDWE